MSNYITQNRALIEAIKNVSAKHALKCDLFSGDWIIRLSSESQTHFIFAYGFDCNTQAASEIASDKVATFELLRDNNLAVVPHFLLKTTIESTPTSEKVNLLLDQYKQLVIKPLDGSRGEAVTLCTSIEEVFKCTERPDIKAWAAAPLIAIQKEQRIVVCNGYVKLAYEKNHPQVHNGIPMFNLNLGAEAHLLTIEDMRPDVKDLAVNAMKAIGLSLGAVDVIFDAKGNAAVLEINSGFSLEHFALISQENRAAVVRFYGDTIEAMFGLY